MAAGSTFSAPVNVTIAEHLGTGICEGMWVGPDSSIPNTKG